MCLLGLGKGFSGPVGNAGTEKEMKETHGETPVLPIQTRLPDRGRDGQPRPLEENLLKTPSAKSELSESPKPSEAKTQPESPIPAESPKPASSPEKSPSKGAPKGTAPPKGASKGKESWLHCSNVWRCTIQHEEIWHFCCLLLQCVKDGKGKGKAKAEPRTCLPALCWTKTNIEENVEKHYKIQHIKRLWTSATLSYAHESAPGCSFSLFPSSVLTMSSWIREETGHQTWCASETFILEFLPCGQRAKHGVEWDWPRRLRVCEETGCGKCKSSKARFRYRYDIDIWWYRL